MLSECSVLSNDYKKNSTIESTISCSFISTKLFTKATLPSQGTNLTTKPTTSEASYLYLEKVKNERMSPHLTSAQFDSIEDVITESYASTNVAATISNNSSIICSNHNHRNGNSKYMSNKLVNNQVQNNNNLKNYTSDESTSHSNKSQQKKRQLQKQTIHNKLQQQHLTLHMSNNDVKKERRSSSTNEDFQISLSRSHSISPTSFQENSVHSSPSETHIQMNDLSTNLFSAIHHTANSNHNASIRISPLRVTNPISGSPNEFSKRNYSDFMRSLAAKYKNENPNESLKRSILFEASSLIKKSSTAAQRTTYSLTPTTPVIKEITIPGKFSISPPDPLTSGVISPSESAIKLSQQNKIAAAFVTAANTCSRNISPCLTSFLSNTHGILPPLIDMTSTQALITLARAAQENEINRMLRPQNAKKSADSPSTGPCLDMAIQQAAQYISPAFISSVRMQKAQQQNDEVAIQSSPCLANNSNTAISNTPLAKISSNQGYKINISPLDLTSQPPAIKRFKAEFTSSQSSIDALIPVTIARRESSPTVTNSTSPAPINEIPFNASSNSILFKTSQPLTLVDSSTIQGETTIAKSLVGAANSTSAIAQTITTHQCQAQNEELNSWTVEDVCSFVSSIDICAEYVKSFRDQCIDGSGLPLLTEDHLVNSLGMKLGPALKLRSVLAKKLGRPCPCVSCVLQAQQMFALQTSETMTTTTTKDHQAVAIDDNGSYNSHLTKSAFSEKSSMSYSSHNNNRNCSCKKCDNTTTTTLSANTSSTIEKCSNRMRNNSNLTLNVSKFSSSSLQSVGEVTETTLQMQHL